MLLGGGGWVMDSALGRQFGTIYQKYTCPSGQEIHSYKLAFHSCVNSHLYKVNYHSNVCHSKEMELPKIPQYEMH